MIYCVYEFGDKFRVIKNLINVLIYQNQKSTKDFFKRFNSLLITAITPRPR